MRFSCLTSTLFVVCWVAAQSPHPAFHNYSTAEGLPSPEVHDILQDREGYLWFATDNGLSRFDGSSFRNYSIQEGLGDPVVFELQEDLKGNIWMSTLSGDMYLLQGDTILPYVYNHRIQEIKELIYVMDDFHWDESSQSLFISTKKIGIIQMDAKGKIKRLYPAESRHVIAYQIADRLLVAQNNLAEDRETQLDEHIYQDNGILPSIYFMGKESFSLHGLPHHQGQDLNLFPYIRAIAPDSYLLHVRSAQYWIHQQQVVDSWPAEGYLQTLSIAKDQSIWAGYRAGAGVWVHQDIAAMKQKQGLHLLRDLSITDIFWDQQEGLWVSTLEQGVFYAPNWQCLVIDKEAGMATDVVSSIASIDQQTTTLSTWKGEIGRFDQNALKYQPQFQTNNLIWDIQYDHPLQRLWISTNESTFYTSIHPPFELSKLFAPDYFRLGSKAIVLPPNSSVEHPRIILNPRIHIQTTPPKHPPLVEIFRGIKQYLLHQTGQYRALHLGKDGHHWLGTDKGLWQLIQDSVRSFQHIHPAFSTRVEAITALSDGSLVIGTKGKGVILWQGDTFTTFSTNKGLTTDMIEVLHVSAQDDIWVGTLQGLFRIFQKDSQWTIQPYNQCHGLPSNEIWAIESKGENIWVGTGKGAAWFKPKPIHDEVAVPRITHFLVNGKSRPNSSEINLPYHENNLNIGVWTPNYRMMGKTPFRYRLDAHQAWEYTHQPNIRYAALSSGIYELEVQAQNEDGIWSGSTILDIQIRPAWYASRWFWMGIGLFASSIFYIFYRQRVDRLKEKLRLTKEMNMLEHQAIRAQMNPHFIFNCLNSIQNFIGQGNDKDALRYLAKFAQLIRQVLNASLQEQVSLQEELDLIENYIVLEKLRFPNSFAFQVNLPPGLDTYDVVVPPLILQPFVENAIIHAFDESTKDPKIWIDLKLEDARLIIQVKDNGVGIDSENQEKAQKEGRKSVGISLTSRRLELYNRQKNQPHFQIQALQDDPCHPSGTVVTLFIDQDLSK